MINSLPRWFWRIYRLVVSWAQFDMCNTKEDMLILWDLVVHSNLQLK